MAIRAGEKWQRGLGASKAAGGGVDGESWVRLAGRQNLNAALELDPGKAAYNQQIGTIASTFR